MVEPSKRGKRIRRVIVIGLVAFAMPGCGGSSSDQTASAGDTPTTTTTIVDRAAVDRLIDLTVNGAKALQNLGKGGDSSHVVLSAFRLVGSDYSYVVDTLDQRPPAGLPSEVARSVALDLRRFVAGVDEVVRCFERAADSPFSGSADSCKVIVNETVDRATVAGTAISELVPYGSRSLSEVLAQFKN